MVFQITLAEKVIEIHSVFKFVYYYCRAYRTVNNKVDFVVQTNLQEIDNELTKSVSWNQNSNARSQYDYGYTEFLLIFRKICNQMPLYSSFLFHGTVVSNGKSGFILTAPSGTGKTTRARLLVSKFPEVFILNGDKPLIQIKEENVFAYGTPWCGKEYIGRNTSVPLTSIFLLQRSDKTLITEIPFETALPELISQTYIPETGNMVSVSMRLLTQLCKNVKIYRYHSTSDALDVLKVYDVAKGIR